MKRFIYFFCAAIIVFMAACTEPIDPSDEETFKTNKNNGLLQGKFSVSDKKQVGFSQGNLQYQASTKTWRFAENQYDFIGSDNKNISSTYTGWIDIFGWGTGNNPTKASDDNKEYLNFYDWGNNVISNGGDKVKSWRTLTKDEWDYLLNYRKDAENLRGRATVNGIKGYVFLADDFIMPSGLKFKANSNDYNKNSFSKSNWLRMESAGAVFLPAAGDRYGIDVRLDKGNTGYYWSSTLIPSANFNNYFGYYFYFSETNVVITARNCFFGNSVRLVKDI